MASRAILSNFSEEQWTQNHPHNFSGLIVGCTFSDNFPPNSWMPIESTQTVPQWLSMRHWGKSAFYLLHMTILYTVPYFIYLLSLSLSNVLHINPTHGKRFGSFQIERDCKISATLKTMHSRFDSWSNIHLLSIIEAFLSGAVRMSLVWISKAVVSHIDEEAMLQSVFYNIVIAILLVTVVGSTHLHLVCHHLSTDGSLKSLARHPPHPLIPRSGRLPPPLIWRSGSATVICLMLLFLGQVTCQNFTLTWPHYIQYFVPIILLLLQLQFLLSKFTGSWDLSKLYRAFHVVQSDDLFT